MANALAARHWAVTVAFFCSRTRNPRLLPSRVTLCVAVCVSAHVWKSLRLDVLSGNESNPFLTADIKVNAGGEKVVQGYLKR